MLFFVEQQKGGDPISPVWAPGNGPCFCAIEYGLASGSAGRALNGKENRMKYKNLKNMLPMNIQFFAETGDGSQDAGGDDQDADQDHADEGGEEEETSEEKTYTEAEMEAAVEKRLARERRKWKRLQSSQGRKPDNGNEDEEGDPGDTAEALRTERERAALLEMKWSCLEHDVKKDCVDDVLALARSYTEKDKDLDIEDAIDKVLEKYPQFKDGAEDQGSQVDGEGQTKSWGQRHIKPPKTSATVEDVIKQQLFGK